MKWPGDGTVEIGLRMPDGSQLKGAQKHPNIFLLVWGLDTVGSNQVGVEVCLDMFSM